MQKKKIIFDTDIGSDDAIALSAIILSNKFDLLGVTTIFGNLPLENTTDNALRLLSFYQLDTPVYPGCPHALVTSLNKGRTLNSGQQKLIKIVNGQEIKIHEKTLPLLPSTNKPQKEHACSFIVNTLRESKEKITLCCVGPLTNIATALIMDPTIINNIEAIYIMGGGIHSGNRTASAEANFYDDPQAAEIVINCGAKVILSPMEACESCAEFNRDDIQEIREIKNPVALYIAKELEGLLDREKILFGVEKDTIYDYGAIVPLIREDAIVDMNCEIGHVDTFGGLSDGTLILDRRNNSPKNTNLFVIEKCDYDIAHELLFELIKNYED